LDIINEVLDFSKIESEQMQLEHIHFDMVDLIEQIMSIFAPLAGDKGLGWYYRIAPQLPRCYLGDPTRVRQIVVNLVNNAMKFTARGKVHLDLDAVPATDTEEAALILRVVDTGRGISEERRQQLFQPFEQGDASIARKYGGSGLGLALCSRLTHLMNGAIDVESVPGQGTVFTVRLPLQTALQPDAFVPGMMSGEEGEIGVLCASPEWRSHLFGQLQAWGVKSRQLERVQDWHGKSGTLMLFGARRNGDAEDEEALMADGRRIIDCREDGPRSPVFQGNRILVSCYSMAGLQRALLLAQESPAAGDGNAGLWPASSTVMAVGGQMTVEQETVRVLVVEDHPVNRELIGDQLHLLGYSACLAANAGEALRMYTDGEFDIVLTDLSMQNVDGYMLTRMLRAQGARLPIVALTAYASPEDQQRCREAGMDDVLLKPISLRAIDRLMRRYLKLMHRRSASSIPADAKQHPQPQKALSPRLLQVLRDSTEASMAQMHAASGTRRHEVVLAQLHAIKGAFAMQQQALVVSACAELERDCRQVIPANFMTRLDTLQSLISQALQDIGQATAGERR